jgi:hypothetical protein
MSFIRFPRLGGPLHARSSRRLAIAGGGPGRPRLGTGRRNCRRPVEQPRGRSSCGNRGAVDRRRDFVLGRLRPPAPPPDLSNDRCWLGHASLSDFATEIFDASLRRAFSEAIALKFDLAQVRQDSARKMRRRGFRQLALRLSRSRPPPTFEAVFRQTRTARASFRPTPDSCSRPRVFAVVGFRP